MDIEICRLYTINDTVIGALRCGSFFCWSLEDRRKVIPEGKYLASLYASPKFGGKNVILLHDIPNREYIEIHVGNTVSDTEGCILVGNDVLGEMVINSRMTLNALLKKFGSRGMVSIYDTRQ